MTVLIKSTVTKWYIFDGTADWMSNGTLVPIGAQELHKTVLFSILADIIVGSTICLD